MQERLIVKQCMQVWDMQVWQAPDTRRASTATSHAMSRCGSQNVSQDIEVFDNNITHTMPNVETQDVSQDMQVLDMQVWDIPFRKRPSTRLSGKKRRSGLLHDTILVVAKEADPQKYICWICFRLLQPTVHSCDHVVQGVGPTPWYKVRHFSLGRSLNLRIQDQMELPRHPQPWCIKLWKSREYFVKCREHHDTRWKIA